MVNMSMKTLGTILAAVTLAVLLALSLLLARQLNLGWFNILWFLALFAPPTAIILHIVQSGYYKDSSTLQGIICVAIFFGWMAVLGTVFGVAEILFSLVW
jgi:hypothetical protein